MRLKQQYRTIEVRARKNKLGMSASCLHFFNQYMPIKVSKNLPFTDLKKCDKIYPKLIDTKINYNSSQLNASEGHSDIYAIGVQSELREIASPNPLYYYVVVSN